ncbi:hypothetical protein LP092_15325 (plasmid) [Moraxella bovis]|uniref:Uncharacterized protein n=1 Tax=Moraxella bovis TaxID=476 RepID=A0ABY6MEM6_MORBO|nr:hypothetical protein [Moraxella bovis]UZA04739.1 hypothetical protein LP092_15325 [Moraxella bovis]
MMKIKVTSSKGKVGYFENDVFIFNGIANRRAGIHFDNQHCGDYFDYDVDNPFCILEWEYNSNDIVVVVIGHIEDIIIIPISNLIIIQGRDITIIKDGRGHHITRDDGKRWVIPVINPDGSIHHKIKHPKYIYNRSSVPSDTFLPKNKLQELLAVNKVSVENFGYISFDKNKNSLIIGLDFHYDWYQERLYNTETQEWGEIVSAGRY